MKTFIGRYFKKLKPAVKFYNKMSDERKKHQSLCEVGGKYFIVGNSTIKAVNEKK